MLVTPEYRKAFSPTFVKLGIDKFESAKEEQY
jgi:hypothetical protein